MIKVLNASTQEMEDPGNAVREILESLDIKNSLLKNSVALLFCNVRFIETGVMEAVCKSLPFDVLGCTSLYFGLSAKVSGGAPSGEGEFVLTVTVLTSDDISFSPGISGPLNDKNAEECVQELYRRTASSPGEPPSLVFAFPPTITSVPGDLMAAALDHVCGGIPVFGSVALDMNIHIQNPKTIFKTASECGAFSDRMTLLLFRGQVNPRFFYSSFPEKSILSWDAVITKAVGHCIISINNRPALSFIKDLGFFKSDTHESAMLYPMVVEYPNNETKVVVLQDVGPEGQLVCSVNVQTGGVLNIGATTADSVLEGAKALAQGLKNNGRGTDFIMFSCFLRNVVLGGSSKEEFDLIGQELDGYPGSWLFVNSGGELCPCYRKNGETVNIFHQYALVACQF
jgi:hypothetical protein